MLKPLRNPNSVTERMRAQGFLSPSAMRTQPHHELHKENQELRGQIVGLEKHLAGWQEHAKRLTEEAERAEANVAKAMAEKDKEVHTLKISMFDHWYERERAEKKNKGLLQEQAEVRATLECAREEMEALRARTVAAEEQLKELHKEADGVLASEAALKSRLEQREAAAAQAMVDAAAKEAAAEAVAQKAEALTRAAEQAMAHSMSDVQRREEDLRRRETELCQREAAVEERTAELREQEDKHKERAAELQARQAQVVNAERVLAEAQEAAAKEAVEQRKASAAAVQRSTAAAAELLLESESARIKAQTELRQALEQINASAQKAAAEENEQEQQEQLGTELEEGQGEVLAREDPPVSTGRGSSRGRRAILPAVASKTTTSSRSRGRAAARVDGPVAQTGGAAAAAAAPAGTLAEDASLEPIQEMQEEHHGLPKPTVADVHALTPPVYSTRSRSRDTMGAQVVAANTVTPTRATRPPSQAMVTSHDEALAPAAVPLPVDGAKPRSVRARSSACTSRSGAAHSATSMAAAEVNQRPPTAAGSARTPRRQRNSVSEDGRAGKRIKA